MFLYIPCYLRKRYNKIRKKCQFVAFFSICTNFRTILCEYKLQDIVIIINILSNHAHKPFTAFVISSRSIFSLLTFAGLEAS